MTGVRHRSCPGILLYILGERVPVADQAWTLDWDTMELAKPLHSKSLQSLSYHISPAPGVLTFVLTSP
jgi:hypothetical protein